MNEITIHEVGMQNYGPYIDPMILEFKNDTVTLLVGPNGVGKTMALDAIPFTLFGTTSKGLKGDDLINNVVQKNCHTWVKFSANEDNYHVKKYQKYSKFGGTTVILNKNGVDIKKGAKEVLPEIERLWYPEKSFMNTVMFGQKVKDFFTDLTDSKQKEIFRKLLGLDNYVHYYKLADTDMKTIAESMQEIQSQINVKQGLIAESYDRIKELEEVKKQFNIDRGNQIREFQQLVEQSNRIIKNWEETVSDLKTKDHNPDALQIEIDNIQQHLDDIEAENEVREKELQNQKDLKIYEIKSKADEAREKLANENNKVKDESIADWRNEQRIINDHTKELTEQKHKLEMDIQTIRSNMIASVSESIKIKDSVFESKISSCPICLQEITDSIKDHLKNEIRKLEKHAEDCQKEIDDYTTHLNKCVKEIDSSERQLKTTDIHYDQELETLTEIHTQHLKEVNTRLENVLGIVEMTAAKELTILQAKSLEQVKKLTETITKLKVVQLQAKQNKEELDKAEEGLSTAKTAKEVLQKQIEQKENEEYNETQLNGYKTRIIQYTKEVETLTTSIKDNERKYKLVEFWKAGYSPTGIPSILIDESIPFMNKRVAQYLEEISNGRYIISFDTQDTIKSGEVRDKISVKVLDTQTRANQRRQLSGGQTRLVDIATILTLGDLQSNNLGIKTNLLIFDEIFDSLDAQNIDYVSKVLTRLKKGRSIYLISHTHQDQLEADNVLELKA
jgi:DNA repair exonuclease SbcCD ATPase subunit